MSDVPNNPAEPPAPPTVKQYANNALASGCGCAFALPLAVLFLGIIYHVLDSRCGTPGDSGGCEMGIFGAVIAAIIPGLVIGLLSGIAMTWWEYRKKQRARKKI